MHGRAPPLEGVTCISGSTASPALCLLLPQTSPLWSCCTPSPHRFSNNIMGWLAVRRCLTQANTLCPLVGRGAGRNADPAPYPLPRVPRFNLCASPIGGLGPIPERIISSLHIWIQTFVRHNKERLKSIFTCAVRQAV